jgi:hypothetical protein
LELNRDQASPALKKRRAPSKKAAKEVATSPVAEGRMTQLIEQQTARFQSVDWLALAIGSMGLSAITTLLFRRRALGNFFGLWAPSLLLIGVYNKLVKVEANLEGRSRQRSR